MKKMILKCILIMVLLPFSIFAKENTAIESFITQVKETNKFVIVNDLWVEDKNFDKSILLKIVEKSKPLVVDYNKVATFIKSKKFAISLMVPAVDGSTYTIDMALYNFLTSDFQVHVKGVNNSDGIFNYTPGLYYRGIVNGIPGSVAAFSFFENEIYGIFSIPGEGNYTLVPNTMVGNYYDYNQSYILYNDNDLKITSDAPGCDVDGIGKQSEEAVKMGTTINNNVYNSCTEIRVYEVADYAMFLTKGKSVTKTVNYLTALFNNQSTIYKNEGIPIVLKYMDVDSVTDSYQGITTASSFAFLTEFGNVTKNNMHGCDVALLTSTAFGSMGGVAWLRAMCSKYNPFNSFGPYGFCNLDKTTTSAKFPTYSWNVEVMCHEMGHIVGSPHTHSCCWNPPGTGTTAIDGCMTLEGSCAMPVPKLPTAGGTIMSYCHLTSKGINFSNGFGQQPGDTVRWFIFKQFSSSCGAVFTPTSTPLSTANRTINANRECTDMTTATTYYWYDNNTADHTDDTLILMLKKNGNDIGNLNTTGFLVSASTISGYGSGTGYSTSFKPGTLGVKGTNYAMHRYWTMRTPTEPKSPVDVMFPFSKIDSIDLSGSTSVKPPISKYKFYKTSSFINPNPSIDSLKHDAGISIYSIGATPSTTNWSLSNFADYNIASMQMTSLSGGGSGIFAYGTVSIESINDASGFYIYPNPALNQWNISVLKTNSNRDLRFALYSVDGKMLRNQKLTVENVNTIDASELPIGLYFYRIVGENNVVTGNLIKK